MPDKFPLEYKIFLTGPFNTGMKFDYSQLSVTYEQTRKKLLKEIKKHNVEDCRFYIKKFKDSPEKLQQWLDSDLGGKQQSKKLIFSETQGQTHRDSSIISALFDCEIKPEHESFGEIKKYFAEIPLINKLKIQFHETGIGVFSATIDIKLKEFPPLENNVYKIFTKILRDSFILSASLQDKIKNVEKTVNQAAKNISQDEEKTDNIIDIDRIYPNESYGNPLWGHAVAIMQHDYEGNLPFGENTKDLLYVSHPDGLIDMNNLSAGFVHIGWGISLAVNILPNEILALQSTMEQLEFYWRSAQILNDLIMKYLEKYSQVKKFSLKKIKQSLNEIEKLTIESELFYSYHMDYLKMLSPLSHFFYQETAKSWRINQMLEYFDSKRDALSKLHEQGEARIKENIESKRDKMSNRLNVLLSILALLTLFSWATDSLGFLDATLSLLPSLKNYLIGGKFFVIVSTPLIVVGIFYLFFKLTRSMKEIEE
ncbi:MAG: hypothetical protein KGY75_08860 [Candidatus Cloacimonetes bacterium]|nr:hypothetical protein [Candidatus Cloacimonadota bacterium]MBS3768207.1 hypothetical protein [Candidatus Cloacimonadota bacterium]